MGSELAPATTKTKRMARAKGGERGQDPPGQMNKTRQTEISSEFLAGM